MTRLCSPLLIAATCFAFAGTPAAKDSAIKTGGKAPQFICPQLGGGSVNLKELTAGGKVVLMSFFHTTCKPCIAEIPRLTKIAKERGAVAAYLVFVGTEDDDTVKKFLTEHDFTLPVLMDRSGIRMGERYKVVEDDMAHVPQIMVVSKNGILRAAWTGFPAGQDEKLAALLDDLIAEAKVAPAAEDTLTVLFTNNTNGLTGPSPAIDVGGLAKRATVIRRERAAAPASLLVDAGDLFPTSPDERRTAQVVAAYGLMDYDAVTIGEAEFVNGMKYLRGVIGEKKIPFVSANLKICEDETCVDLVRPHAVVTAGKRKVAVAGYLHADSIGFTPEERMADGKWKLKITDPRPPLKGFLARFGKEADVRIVLSHAGIEEDRKLAQEVPGIDVIVGAHSQTFLSEPVREGNTLIVQAASDGQYLGKLVLKFGEDGKPRVDAYELIPLTKNIADDAAVKAVLGNGKIASATKAE